MTHRTCWLFQDYVGINISMSFYCLGGFSEVIIKVHADVCSAKISDQLCAVFFSLQLVSKTLVENWDAQ